MDHPTRRLDMPNQDPRTVCPKCGGERLWADVRVTDETRYGSNYPNIEFARAVGTGLLGDVRYIATYCMALVCTGCGFAEFYAHRPADLLKET
jgi:predicted nucleic-acid-binding Zn-ribbon protein